MNIAVIGTGYVGLVTGTCFAETGNTVTCVDIDAEKIEKLNNGIVPIYEPGLKVLFDRNVQQNRLFFTTNLAEAVEKSIIVFLALPTPPGEDGSADLSYVLDAAQKIGGIINDYKVIVDKSTVPVGTAEKVRKVIEDETTTNFAVVSNPEFLREGIAVEDFLKPDRVVVGTSDKKAIKILEELYAPFVRQGNPIIFMDERSAEMTKYSANSYLAMRISFMNEIANLCERVGADVSMVRKGIGSDNRIGKRFLFPGVGYGGSCFPKDVQALKKMAEEHNYDFKILESVMEVNRIQKTVIVKKIYDYYSGNLKGKRIAIWGLAFKPNTDDIREAPSLYVIEELLSYGCEIIAFDPEAMDNVKQHFGNKIEYSNDPYNALSNADSLTILTEWSMFRTPDFNKMSKALKHRVIFDGRNLYNRKQLNDLGYYYNSIGRKVVASLTKVE